MALDAARPRVNEIRAESWILPSGRLRLRDGPIDLVIFAEGPAADVSLAYAAASDEFAGILDRLCAELALLRREVGPCAPHDPIGRRMWAAVTPLAQFGFITPMAAVAGAVAEAVLSAMLDAGKLRRAAVNNGGDIALHLEDEATIRLGMVARPEEPSLFGSFVLTGRDTVRGVATSGRHGRSFSLGIADAVTVLAASAAQADAAATVIANAVDLPGNAAVVRRPASSLQADSDLGERLVTRDVAALGEHEVDTALAAGLRRAEALIASSQIVAAALLLQGRTRVVGDRFGPDRET